MDNSLYQIKNLHLKKSKFNLSIKKFDIHRGAVYMFSGKINSGKSLVLDILAKNSKYNGLLQYDGKNLSDYSKKAYMKEVAVISKLPFSFSNGEAYIKKYIKKYDAIKTNFKNVNNLIKRFGVGDALSKRVCCLPPSQKRVLNLIAAIAAEPKVILIDDIDMYLTLDELKTLKSILNKKSSFHGVTVVATCRYVHNFTRFASVNITLDSGRIIRVRS